MTPALNVLRRARVAHTVHEYRHDPSAPSYGLEAALALGVEPSRVFKTLVADVERVGLVVAVVPVAGTLDLKALAASCEAKRARMAETGAAERATGYVVGGISPLGQRKSLPLLLDRSAESFATIYVSAGRRGLEIELAASDLLRLSGGRYASLARNP